MGLCDLYARLRADVTSKHYQSLFELACQREAVLANYDSIKCILHVLESVKPSTYALRDQLIRALLREHQRCTSGLWGAVLLVVFAPMLCRLRARLRSDADACQDVDQWVLEGFLVAIGLQRTDARSGSIAAHLRARAYRFVFGRLAAERRQLKQHRQLARYARYVDGFESWVQMSVCEPSVAEMNELAELLYVAVGSLFPKRRLDVVVATRLRGMTLRQYVTETGVSSVEASGELARGLQRITREHARTLKSLRSILKKRLALVTSIQI